MPRPRQNGHQRAAQGVRAVPLLQPFFGLWPASRLAERLLGERQPRRLEISSLHFLYVNSNSCYSFLTRRIKTADVSSGDIGQERHALEAYCIEALSGEKFFIFFGCNSLKRPNSAKGIQGNPSFFIWIFLDFLGFA
jgi:hypothetical protein